MPDERFFDEFAEDFFAESTEHLQTVRAALLELEDALGTAALLPAPRIAALMRSLHTLKGLSGMVGLTDAASIAHGMEEVLRIARLELKTVPLATLQLLFDATHTLDLCLTAYRSGAPAPDVAVILDRLQEYAAVAVAGDPATGASAQHTARPNYTFTFTPSAELAARGIGVELVRTRLQSLGDVVRVLPRVAEGGGISFEFSVLLEPEREPLDLWRADGMDWRMESPLPQPALAAVAASRAAATSLPSARLVRVDLARLDELMLLVGDLVMSRARLQDEIARLRQDRSNAAFAAVEDSNTVIERQVRDLRSAVMRVRLVPIGEVFERMRFVARDVARETGKQVRVLIAGGTTEIDKLVVERMLEPLLHLVRNAVSHGIEPAEQRLAAGKDPIGLITLRAQSAGDQIVIDVMDDGRGLDAERIQRLAQERGVLQRTEQLADVDLLDILCTPGFSTSNNTDLASGRGVGMEVVLKTVQNIGGELRLETEKNAGTRFTIRLPLTLMIVDALLVSVAGQTYAIPQPSLREVLQISADEIVGLENNEVIRYRDGVLPLIRLRHVFSTQAGTNEKFTVLVVGNEIQQMGLVVDRLLGLREIVVRPVADPLVAVPGIAGAAELSDGSVALILDATGLVQYAQKRKLRLA
ncbi:MAG TPA: chemotaxis protein CheA [Longimicrobiales bacterium]